MDSATNYMPVVTTVLAIGAAFGPIMFGFAAYKMSQVFVSKAQFEEFKKDRTADMEDTKGRLVRIEQDVKELLSRRGTGR